MAGESDWGSTSTYIGKGSPPKSDWEYSNRPLRDHLDTLKREAGIPLPPPPTLADDRAGWAALRARRSMQA